MSDKYKALVLAASRVVNNVGAVVHYPRRPIVEVPESDWRALKSALADFAANDEPEQP